MCVPDTMRLDMRSGGYAINEGAARLEGMVDKLCRGNEA